LAGLGLGGGLFLLLLLGGLGLAGADLGGVVGLGPLLRGAAGF
jgi:hypothetical protein